MAARCWAEKTCLQTKRRPWAGRDLGGQVSSSLPVRTPGTPSSLQGPTYMLLRQEALSPFRRHHFIRGGSGEEDTRPERGEGWPGPWSPGPAPEGEREGREGAEEDEVRGTGAGPSVGKQVTGPVRSRWVPLRAVGCGPQLPPLWRTPQI